MGPVIVETMAGVDFPSKAKKLHPFFTAPKSLQHDTHDAKSTPTICNIEDSPNLGKEQDDSSDMDQQESHMPRRKRRKTAEETDQDWEDNKKPRRGRKKAAPPAASIMNHFSKINDESKDPSARDQPSAPPQRVELKQEKSEALSAITQAPPPAADSTGEVAGPEDVKTRQEQSFPHKTPPKKILQLNRKTGTIGSPPKPKEPQTSKQSAQAEATTKSQDTPAPKRKRRSTRIVTINYGTDDASRKRIGDEVDQILSATASPSTKPKTRTRKPPRARQRDESPESKTSESSNKKQPHPFFTGKIKKTNAPAPSSTPASNPPEAVKAKPAVAASRTKIFSSTPCSPRKTRVAAPSMPLPQFGVRSLGLKTPGARQPAWPPKDMVHVRGEENVNSGPTPHGEPLAARKAKGNTIHLTPQEMILNDFAAKLRVSETADKLRNVDNDTFQPPPPELRLPHKYFESGMKLEKRVLREVKNAQHPALAHLRASLVSSLPAFDRFTCESICWAQKYTPKSAVEVLQCGKEAFLLRDWLEALKVQSVDTGDSRPKPAKPPRKKRKQNNLDDFIVDSDEEADDMEEISDLEENWSPDRRGAKRTVIRAGDAAAKDSKNSARLKNTVVISGPHGCGKTSAVYAIAKELDFEIFEINAGSRRSGKDILEKIGDMTRNHLVQHHQADSAATSINEEEVAEDIKSGKQATMNSFFKAKIPSQSTKPKKPVKKEAPAPVKTEQKRAPPKNQKQSLILLDEVDILYEEDKQFWSTTITLIAQSKRPFIMTCNDENLVPLQTLSLHGIFRFSASPADLAVDRMLIIAACEGHVLCRSAVEALYDARQKDVRACLMDLNYWCQMAVGDRRGGIAWFYPRWPRGCDIDEDGNVVRVISQDAYVEGMGWLAHDVLAQEADENNREEELIREARDYWQMDVGNWHESLDLASWAAKQDGASLRDRLEILQSYEDFTDAISQADLSSSMAFAMSYDEAIDCTLPEITDKAREDYSLGRQLLDATVASTYDSLALSLSIKLKCLARGELQASTPGSGSSHLNTLDESHLNSKIRQHETEPPNALTRDDFSSAFDALAICDKANTPSAHLGASVLDGTLRSIAIDVAPYVRSIVAFEKELQKQRQKLSSLLSQGGKRMRKTRASHAALEGGSRSTTRRDKWFDANLNGYLVMRTAGEGWAAAIEEATSGSRESSTGSVSESTSAQGRSRSVFTDGNDETDSTSEVEVI